MEYNFGILLFFLSFKLAKCDLEGYITGGSFVPYSQYPHSVFLHFTCKVRYICGGSVLNQDLVLTAAHCFEHCKGSSSERISVKYGHEDIDKMDKTRLKDHMLHHNYEEETVNNDIALILTERRIPLNDVVKRVIVMISPPATDRAFVAGWGVDEKKKKQVSLKHTDAQIHKLQACTPMGNLPAGVFCAGPFTGLGAAAQGDSGSALVTKQYIQIGLVSFKMKDYSLVAYTNVSYFYYWIKDSAKRLYCRYGRNRKTNIV